MSRRLLGSLLGNSAPCDISKLCNINAKWIRDELEAQTDSLISGNVGSNTANASGYGIPLMRI